MLESEIGRGFLSGGKINGVITELELKIFLGGVVEEETEIRNRFVVAQ
jgi:hypothetical protein